MGVNSLSGISSITSKMRSKIRAKAKIRKRKKKIKQLNSQINSLKYEYTIKMTDDCYQMRLKDSKLGAVNANNLLNNADVKYVAIDANGNLLPDMYNVDANGAITTTNTASLDDKLKNNSAYIVTLEAYQAATDKNRASLKDSALTINDSRDYFEFKDFDPQTSDEIDFDIAQINELYTVVDANGTAQTLTEENKTNILNGTWQLLPKNSVISLNYDFSNNYETNAAGQLVSIALDYSTQISQLQIDIAKVKNGTYYKTNSKYSYLG